MHQPLLRPPVGARAATDSAEAPQPFGRVRKQTLFTVVVGTMLLALVGRSVLESVAPDWSSQHLAPALLQLHWRNATGGCCACCCQ